MMKPWLCAVLIAGAVLLSLTNMVWTMSEREAAIELTEIAQWAKQ